MKAGAYWDRPPDLPEFLHDWIDPEPDIRGMLLADRIQYYVELVRLIDPFDPKNLKPASYSLTLGPNYQIRGVNFVLTDEDPVLVIPRNSIVFVSMGERLRLPHYIAARFNLAIDHVYHGLLLGTGPQVDPGFQGVLSCPLHNISNQPILITRGNHLATIDFIKTTTLAERSAKVLRDVESEEELYQRHGELLGKEGKSIRLFAQDKKWKRPIIGYPPGNTIVGSSVAELESRVKSLRRTLTWGAFGGVLAALALVIGLGTFDVNLHSDIKGDLRARDNTIELLRKRVETQDADIALLKRQVQQITKQTPSK